MPTLIENLIKKSSTKVVMFGCISSLHCTVAYLQSTEILLVHSNYMHIKGKLIVFAFESEIE